MYYFKSLIISLLLFVAPIVSQAYVSGSTGIDGILNITADTELALPPSGVLNYTSVTIAAGATLTFKRNAANTPVFMLISGDAVIAGTIDVSGGQGGALGEGYGGVGGPGGYSGGKGAYSNIAGLNNGEAGQGPGGARGGGNRCGTCAASSGSYATLGGSGLGGGPGPTYGTTELIHLLGGSGGAGRNGYSAGPFNLGGGGGGGAILIAASGTITLDGEIAANGGIPFNCPGNTCPGGGSGGAIKLISTQLNGAGRLSVIGGNGGTTGGRGRIRVETEDLQFAGSSSTSFSFSAPNPVFYTNIPKIRIATIGGVSVLANPTGFRDVVLPDITANPVIIAFETSGVPISTVIDLKLTPDRSSGQISSSSPVTGTEASGQASVEVTFPNGHSLLEAQATFTVTASNTESATSSIDTSDYSRYANGQSVEKIRVGINQFGQSFTTFITFNGEEYDWPSQNKLLN